MENSGPFFSESSFAAHVAELLTVASVDDCRGRKTQIGNADSPRQRVLLAGSNRQYRLLADNLGPVRYSR